MTLALTLFGGLLCRFVGAVLLRHALVLLWADDENFRSAKQSSPGSASQALTGAVDPYAKKRRDYAISAGIASRADGKLIPQGRLSDEIVDSLI